MPALRAAIVGSTIGYAVMVMAMTATPLAMLGCGFNTSDVKPVIQWHVFGMFWDQKFDRSSYRILGQ